MTDYRTARADSTSAGDGALQGGQADYDDGTDYTNSTADWTELGADSFSFTLSGTTKVHFVGSATASEDTAAGHQANAQLGLRLLFNEGEDDEATTEYPGTFFYQPVGDAFIDAGIVVNRLLPLPAGTYKASLVARCALGVTSIHARIFRTADEPGILTVIF